MKYRISFNRLSLLIAYRYFYATKSEKTIALMMKICFFGIALGACALTMVLCIMSGFEQVTHKKLQGVHADIIMQAYGAPLNMQKITKVFTDEFPAIQAWSPYGLQQALVYSDTTETSPTVITIKGIFPQQEMTMHSLHEKIIQSDTDNSLRAMTDKNKILIGKGLAELLEVGAGDPITLLLSDNQQHGRSLKFHENKAKVGGIFFTGIEEFDTTMILCAFPFFEQLFPEADVTHLNIKLKPDTDEVAIIAQLQDRFGLDVYSWKDLYPALVSALKLEKYVMFFILILILLVASMNIISLLSMIIIQKRNDIAILKAMGMRDSDIRAIFFIVGLTLSVLSSCCGLLLAAIGGLLLKQYPFITLPDAYYATHLPIVLHWHYFAMVLCSVLIITLLALIVATKKIETIKVTHVLRENT